MAYVAPTTRADGYVVDAAEYNKNTVENVIALRAGAIAVPSAAIGDLVIATSTTQLGRVADVATGQVLASGGVGVAPAYTASPTVTAITAATVTCTGQVVISGAAAGQIVFPGTQNASADVNTLDDYEEGTWTPVIGGSGGTSGQTYTIQKGRYVKIGKLVTAYFKVAASNKGTITTNAQIQGLPFTAENTADQDASCLMAFWNTGAAGTPIVACTGVLAPNTTAITILGAGSAATSLVNLTTANFDTSIGFTGSISFVATA